MILTSPLKSDRDAEAVVVGNHSTSLELRFTTEATVRLLETAHRVHPIMLTQAESLRSSLRKLDGLLKDYTPLMSGSTERGLEKVIRYGAAISEVSSRN